MTELEVRPQEMSIFENIRENIIQMSSQIALKHRTN